MVASVDDALVERAFNPLPLGAIKPKGWLRHQLEIQKKSLTGNIDETWEDLSNNAWLGGERDGWERGPYYADGLVPLAHLLDDEELQAKATKWVEGFLTSQNDDGWFEPEQTQETVDPKDPWSRFVICKVLRQHYEVTEEARTLEAILSFAEYLLQYPDDWSIEDWAEMRWMDLTVTLHWLYEETDEEWLLDLVDMLIERGFDWTDHFKNFTYKRKQLNNPQMATHVVNNAMGIKAPAVHYRHRGNLINREAVEDGIKNLDRFHGQATGLFTGDEHLSGKNPSQGTELCAVVEYMFTLEYLISALGNSAFGDRLERITYNALPAAFTSDMWAHQYDQQANQVLCNVAERSWTNGPTANIFGQTPHFGCCHANFHQGWPKFVSSLWMKSPDGGLASVAYAPSEVTTTLKNGETVSIVQETDYPFEDEVTMRVQVETRTSFPLHLRVPEWTEDPTAKLPSGEVRMMDPGEYNVIDRKWKHGDEIVLSLSSEIETERRYHGSVALHRGPLVFSLPVNSDSKLIGNNPPAGDWEYYPTEAWNYALNIDTTDPETSVTLERGPSGKIPFSPDNPPIELIIEGRRIPEWKLENSWAGEIPHSPTFSDQQIESLTLIPYGSTNLRVTEFPLLE